MLLLTSAVPLGPLAAGYSLDAVLESAADTDTPNRSRDIESPLPKQHFCCSSVDLDGKGSGEGCMAIGEELINSCVHVLYCAGSWGRDEDVTKCL